MRARAQFKTDRSREGSRKGFSLVELLIVVAVILILVAIAIPNFIRAKMHANETAAAENLRSITTSEIVYSTTYGIGFAADLTKLSGNMVIADSNSAGLIDSVLASGVKSGYSFTYAVLTTDAQGHATSYSTNADPLIVGTSGQRHFYTDQSSVIRSNSTGPAGPTDPPLQ